MTEMEEERRMEEEYSCSVCGEDKIVSLPDEIFEFPGQPRVTCNQLEEAGFAGVIPLEQCPFLPPIIKNICACASNATSAPTVPLAPSPPTPAPTPSPTPGSCSICGSNYSSVVTARNATFTLSVDRNISCAALEQAGYSGLLPDDYCREISVQVTDVCQCSSSNNASSSLPPKWKLPTQGPYILAPSPKVESIEPQNPKFWSNGGTVTTVVISGLVGSFLVIGLLVAFRFSRRGIKNEKESGNNCLVA